MKIKEFLDRVIPLKIGTSNHGNCCTCVECKFYHDDCQCEYNRIAQDLRNNLTKEIEVGNISILK